MKKLLMLLVLIYSTFAFGTEFAGVTLDDKKELNSIELNLNGVGLRQKAFLKLYVGSLYTEYQTDNSASIIGDDTEMAVELIIVSKIISNKMMKEAVMEGFEITTAHLTDPTVMDQRISTFVSTFEEEITKGDRFIFNYDPNLGTIVSKNGKELTTVSGLDFKRALFAIWLGDEPADKKLKAGMLGK